MTEGTATRSAAEIDAAAEALGASLGAGAGWDGAQLGLTVRTADAGTAAALIADVARNATLSARGARAPARDRRRCGAGLDARSGRRRRHGAARALYGASAYGHPSGGTAASLAAITRADIAGRLSRRLAARQRHPDLRRRHRSGRGARARRAPFRRLARRRGARRPRRRAAPGAAHRRDRDRHAGRGPGGGRGGAQRPRPPRSALLPRRSSPMRCWAAATARASTRRSASAAASPTARAAASTRAASRARSSPRPRPATMPRPKCSA